MEDSIKSNNIFNRKIVVEIRYEANPSIIDCRGTLINRLIESKIIPNPQWEMGIGEVKIADTLKPNLSRQAVFSDLHRLTIISSLKDTNEKFYHFVDRTYKIFKEVVPSFTIIRIGCRIQGTYQAGTNDYIKIIQRFKNQFPSQVFLEDFNIKDLRFQLNYQNGQYHIGPVGKDDIFLKNEFPYEDVNTNIGFAIDTDNFIIRSKEKEIISDSRIRDVYITSLSVEKSLFDKLSSLLGE